MSNIKEVMQVLKGLKCMYMVYLQGNVFDILFFL